MEQRYVRGKAVCVKKYESNSRWKSLDVLKLYCGEDIVRQEPADVDPDLWVDEES